MGHLRERDRKREREENEFLLRLPYLYVVLSEYERDKNVVQVTFMRGEKHHWDPLLVNRGKTSRTKNRNNTLSELLIAFQYGSSVHACV